MGEWRRFSESIGLESSFYAYIIFGNHLFSSKCMILVYQCRLRNVLSGWQPRDSRPLDRLTQTMYE